MSCRDQERNFIFKKSENPYDGRFDIISINLEMSTEEYGYVLQACFIVMSGLFSIEDLPDEVKGAARTLNDSLFPQILPNELDLMGIASDKNKVLSQSKEIENLKSQIRLMQLEKLKDEVKASLDKKAQ